MTDDVVMFPAGRTRNPTAQPPGPDDYRMHVMRDALLEVIGAPDLATARAKVSEALADLEDDGD